MIDESLLYRAIDEATRLGASYAEARYHSLNVFNFYLLNGKVIGGSYSDSTGVSVRVYVGGGQGFASASTISWESIADTVKRAISAARTSATSRKSPARLAPARLGTAKYSVAEKKPLSSISEDAKILTVREALNGVEMKKGDMEIESHTVAYRESVEEKVIANTDGAFVASRVPRVEVFYNLTGKHGALRANRWRELGGSGGLEVLDGMDLASSIQDDVDSLHVNLVKARNMEGTRRLDVVLSPEIVGLSVHESAGHPSEADRVLGREAAQAGLSYRTEMGEGERIGSEHVTIIDDPTIPGSMGFYLYDDEGVAARPRVLIDKGVLRELLHNRETAASFGVESNAASRALDYRSEPIVRMANTYMAPGDYSLDEMLEDIKDGVYIKKYMEWNIDDKRWIARYVGLEAYRIRNGRIEEPLKNVVLEISTRDYYGRIDAVGKDLRFEAGSCGKGEPMQPLPVWMGGPHVRLRGVEVKGA